MLEILYLLQTRGDFEGARSTHASNRNVFLEMTVPGSSSDSKTDAYTNAKEKIGENRLLKTHLYSHNIKQAVR